MHASPLRSLCAPIALLLLLTACGGGGGGGEPALPVEVYIKAANPDAEDDFGLQIAISGETLVVGVREEDSDGSGPSDNSLLSSGAVYVFVRTGDEWTQQAYLKASNAEAADSFGYAVAISGDTLVVGAPGEDSDGSSEADNSLSRPGAVFVFVRAGGVWTQQAYLKASNLDSEDFFGASVAISGDTLAIGSAFEDSDGSSEADNSMSAAGAAYVFTRTGTLWSQQAYLKASNPDPFDEFGARLALDGETLVVSARAEAGDGSSEADNSASLAGAVYVFVRAGGTWMQQAYLKASNAAADDYFGDRAVAIQGDRIVVGATGEDGNGTSEADDSLPNSGAAYVFLRMGTTWVQEAYLKASNADAGDAFGRSGALTGDVIAIGAAGEASSGSDPLDNSTPSGAGYVFLRSAGLWSETSWIKASNPDAGDRFGISAAFAPGWGVVFGADGEGGDGSSPSDNSLTRAGAIYAISLP